MRINTYLREKGHASRREADELITSGKVTVNGKKALLGMQISPTDVVTVAPSTKKYVYYAYNKPRGIITTAPQKGERDIVSQIKTKERVFPIGRLDKDSEGLIILTNDGRITSTLLDPQSHHEKEYEITVQKPITNEALEKLSRGLTIKLKTGNYKTKPSVVKRIGSKKFTIILEEGKNRQIRRMCEALHYSVENLKRIRIGDIWLGNLKSGELRKIQLI